MIKFWKKWIQYFNDIERVYIDGLWIVSLLLKFLIYLNDVFIVLFSSKIICIDYRMNENVE